MGCMHGCHHHGKYGLVRMILKIVIVILIFWCGFRLGNIVGSVRGAGYERNSFGMMRTNFSQGIPVTNPSTPTTLTPVTQ